MKRLFLVVTLLVMAIPASAADLAGSEWGLGPDDTRSVQFGSGDRVSGHAGCNRFMAEYARSGSKLRIDAVASTRMLCPPEQMKLEEEWLGILKRVRSFELTHLKLTLFGPKRTRLVVLKRRDWD